MSVIEASYFFQLLKLISTYRQKSSWVRFSLARIAFIFAGKSNLTPLTGSKIGTIISSNLGTFKI